MPIKTQDIDGELINNSKTRVNLIYSDSEIDKHDHDARKWGAKMMQCSVVVLSVLGLSFAKNHLHSMEVSGRSKLSAIPADKYNLWLSMR